MIKSSNRKNIALLVVAGLLSSHSVFAAGFEKSILWSASAAAQGGAVVGSTKGAESLYFNPAGLSETSGKFEISGNFSPTFSKFEGANPYQGRGMVEGVSGFSPVAALLVSHKMTDKLGVGLGYYVSGGTKAKFENLDYSAGTLGAPSSTAFRPTVETDLKITEASLGFGYEIMPGFRFGAAWRAIMVDANFETVIGAGAASYVAARVSDISATRWNGYKLGMQYDAQDKSWGAGVAYRSGVKFIAKGDATRYTSAAPTTVTSVGGADIENSFPQQLNVGGYMKVTPSLRISPEYSFTNYSDNKELSIRGGLVSNIAQNWKNQHIGRLGFEYTGMSMPIRFGYAYTSQVTPKNYARSTFASPGAGHSIAAGTGMVFGDFDFDIAAEYAMASGKGTNDGRAAAALPGEVATESEFKAHAYVGHLSAKYRF
jgi:long-subunit fatty acid transport protein